MNNNNHNQMMIHNSVLFKIKIHKNKFKMNLTFNYSNVNKDLIINKLTVIVT